MHPSLHKSNTTRLNPKENANLNPKENANLNPAPFLAQVKYNKTDDEYRAANDYARLKPELNPILNRSNTTRRTMNTEQPMTTPSSKARSNTTRLNPTLNPNLNVCVCSADGGATRVTSHTQMHD